jgi:hypothetical protein
LSTPPTGGGNDPSEDVAHWLKEVGRRRAHPGRRESDALLAHLEHLCGKPLRTRADIDAFVQSLAGRTQARRGPALKNALLGALLVISVLQYYFIEVQLQILSQPTLTVFARQGTPAPSRPLT